jgi:hypothetical protein
MKTINKIHRIGNEYELHHVTNNDSQIWELVKANWQPNKAVDFWERRYEPESVKEWYQRPTQQQIDNEIMLNDWSRWNESLKPGQIVEIGEAVYWSLLECLPPKLYNGNYFEVGEPNHHDNKGRAVHRACWIDAGKYFTGYPKSI